jgi:hypothetical protein
MHLGRSRIDSYRSYLSAWWTRLLRFAPARASAKSKRARVDDSCVMYTMYESAQIMFLAMC